MLTQGKNLAFIVAALAVTISGCGPKAAPSTSVTDTPGYHYHQGLKALDADRLDDAMREFGRAVALDPKSPLGYVGQGLVLGKKGECKPAIGNMEKAKGYEKKGVEAHIGMIRLYGMQASRELKLVGDLVKSAEKEFKAANDKERNNPRLYYYMGMCYTTALDFDKAAALFRAVLDMNRGFVAEANAGRALIQKVERAAPATEIGKKIALIDKLDRAGIAALLDQEMNLGKLFTRRGVKISDAGFKAPAGPGANSDTETAIEMEPAADIADNWLRPSIETVLHFQIRGLDAGSNRLFEPGKFVTRGEFACMLEDILVKATGNEKPARKFLGATSPFPDVRNDQYCFSAAMTATSRGLLEADKATGEFRPGDAVSGADALIAIRSFKDQLAF
ncbi:MAG TPA: S-layer homology domain-containing protein [Nitrospirota bacterium]